MTSPFHCLHPSKKSIGDRVVINIAINIFYAMGKNIFEFIVGNVRIPMIIDSDADANVITEEIWKKVNREGIKVTDFTREIDRKLIAYATNKPMKVLGIFHSNIRVGSNEVDDKFYIVEQGQRNLLLLLLGF